MCADVTPGGVGVTLSAVLSQVAFELMNVMAVISNTALLAISPKGQEFMDVWGEAQFILVLVIAEVSRCTSQGVSVHESECVGVRVRVYRCTIQGVSITS